MKRILLEVMLVLGLAGAGFFGWTNYTAVQGGAEKLKALTTEVETTTEKLKAAETELKATTQELSQIRGRTQELEAVRAALANGETLKDLEAAYKKEKTLTPERQVGLGALRLLTNGSQDPGTIDAFKKALDMADWGSRKKVICAAQNGLAAGGQDVKVLSECAGAQPVAKVGDAAAKKDAPGKQDGSAAPDEKAGKAKDGKQAVHWGYEGAMGPDRWGDEFPTCARGQSQSPLNIRGPFEKALFELAPDYKNGPLKIINNGHSIQVNVPPGSKLRIDSKPFELVQFHFHRPSEELIDGKPAAMVAHFVHKNSEGRLAVLAVLLKEGNENPGIKLLWQHAPQQEGPEVAPEGVIFNPGNLLPREYEFWSYEGSLTTPPCTEGVRFFILKSPVNIARQQVEQFPFKMNARPVQPQNGRAIAG